MNRNCVDIMCICGCKNNKYSHCSVARNVMKYALQLAGGKVKLFSMVSSHENEAFNVSIVFKIYIHNAVDGYMGE